MAKTRLQIAKRDIVALFDQAEHRIYRRKDIASVLAEHREFWRLTEGETVVSFIEFLIKHGSLKRARFEFPSRTETRYAWRDVPFYELVGTIKPGAYFSHYTAMYFHELTGQIPKTVYLNFEQSPKPAFPGTLTQEKIDASFRRPPRVTSNRTQFRGYNMFLLNGKNTSQLGVTDMIGPEDAKVRATSVERTLIDIVVRPTYAGGVFEVLEAYRLAGERLSVNRLAAFLQKLTYVYPYQQAIGFYLDRSGAYTPSQMDLLRKAPFEVDFYLCNAMKETDYSKEWRLFFPKGF